jgi:hypothetical protein
VRQVDQQWVPTGIGKKVETETDYADPWVKHGNTPGIQRNIHTGHIRNDQPTPAPEPEPQTPSQIKQEVDEDFAGYFISDEL